MTIQTLNNGQVKVNHNNLQIIQTVVNGQKFNDCSICHSDYNELVDQNNPLFKDLFKALFEYNHTL